MRKRIEKNRTITPNPERKIQPFAFLAFISTPSRDRGVKWGSRKVVAKQSVGRVVFVDPVPVVVMRRLLLVQSTRLALVQRDPELMRWRWNSVELFFHRIPIDSVGNWVPLHVHQEWCLENGLSGILTKGVVFVRDVMGRAFGANAARRLPKEVNSSPLSNILKEEKVSVACEENLSRGGRHPLCRRRKWQ